MYNAFISYSHAGDGKMAPALQTALEKFAKPWYKVRNLNIFRDEASLNASPHLWTNLQAALQQSEYLIYMASPTSAASIWIGKEIEYWLEHKPIDNLLIALTDGEIWWDDSQKIFLNADVNSLPLMLEKKFTEEPFYIDLRNSRTQKDLSLDNPIFKKEVLKLAAQLHGKEPKDLAGEEVETHNKMMRLRNAVIITLAFLLIAATYTAWFANEKRIEANDKTMEAKLSKANAERSAMLATAQSQIAREQRDFAVIARRQADSSAVIAQLQKDSAQLERDNAIKQEKIALNEKEIAQANYLLSEAKSAAEYDPTLALRLAEAAMQKHYDPVIETSAYKIYRENSFYKIIGGHKNTIVSVAFSPDGKFILSASKDSSARIWNIYGRLLHTFKDPSQLTCAAFSFDGKYIVTGSRAGTTRLWNMNEQVVKVFKGDSYVEDVAFSPDGKYIVTGAYDSTARLWSIDGKLIREFKKHGDQVTSVAFSPDGKSILCGSYDGIAKLWNFGGDLIREYKSNSIIYAVAFSPNGKYILTGSLDKTAKLWDLQGNLIREFRGHSDAIISVSFSGDGNFVLTGSWDKTAILWDLEGNPVEVFKGNPTWLNAAFSPDGKSIVTGGGESLTMYPGPADHTVRLWAIRKSFHEIRNKSAILASAFSPDKNLVAMGSSDSTIRIFNKEGKLVKEFKAHAARVMDLAFSPDGKYLLSGSLDSSAKLWDLTGHLITDFKGHLESVNAVSFSPDGKYILTGSEDETAKLWNREGRLLRTFAHSSAVRAAVFSPDGKHILTGTNAFGEIARLWDLDGKLIHEYFNNDITYLMALAFAPDGQSFMAGFDNYSMQLMSLNGKLLKEFRGHSAAITCLKFSPSGKSIVSGSKDGTARLWDLDGHCIQEFTGYANMVMSVDFSRDEKSILVGSLDKNARIWDVPMPLAIFLQSNKIELLSAEQKRNFLIGK